MKRRVCPGLVGVIVVSVSWHNVTSYRGHLLLGSNLNCLTAIYPQAFTPSIDFLR